ncbi:MAG: hypothetical protein ABIY55_07715 [Kofleriaceae bacterium]
MDRARLLEMTKKSRASASQLRGKVLAFNISPKGHVEGVLIETDSGVAQLNFTKHGADARMMRVGAKVDVAVELEHDRGDHPVYAPSDAEFHATGTIVRLNHALHGDINGCHLDDGTFVHIKPDEAKGYDLRIGAKVTASGSRRFGADAVVLDAHTIQVSEQRIAL